MESKAVHARTHWTAVGALTGLFLASIAHGRVLAIIAGLAGTIVATIARKPVYSSPRNPRAACLPYSLVVAMRNHVNRSVLALVIGLVLMAVALGGGLATGLVDWLENRPIAWPKIVALVFS